MAIIIDLPKRSEQSSPITASQYDAAMAAIEAAFASVNAGTGSVTSVGLSAPASLFSVSNSPVTSSGSLTFALVTQAANLVLAGPTSGGAATPTFRAIVANDLPQVPVSKGGTGNTSFTASRAIVSDGSGNLGVSSITSTELGYLSGVTSAIQTQLNAKQATISILAVANGGTGASTTQGARLALLPTIATHANKFLRVNSGATDVEWAIPTAGISTLNSQTGATQTFATATTGTDFAISSSGNVHTFSIPNASATARGLVSTGAQTFLGTKTFDSAPIINGVAADKIVVGGASSELVSYNDLEYDNPNNTLKVGYVRESATVTYSSSQTLTEFETYVRSNSPSSALTFTLPVLSVDFIGTTFTIKDVGGQAGERNITIQAQSGDVLDGVGNGTKVIGSNYGAICIKACTDGASNLFYEVQYGLGTIT